MHSKDVQCIRRWAGAKQRSASHRPRSPNTERNHSKGEAHLAGPAGRPISTTDVARSRPKMAQGPKLALAATMQALAAASTLHLRNVCTFGAVAGGNSKTLRWERLGANQWCLPTPTNRRLVNLGAPRPGDRSLAVLPQARG